VRLDVGAQARREVAAHVALEHARRHLHDPLARPLWTRGLRCPITPETIIGDAILENVNC
jgi:hypothetical protein